MKLSQLTEARYYGDRITADQVGNMYYDAYEDNNNYPRMKLSKPRIYESGLAAMSVVVERETKKQAIQYVKKYFDEQNLPYTNITIDYGTTWEWMVVVDYKENN